MAFLDTSFENSLNNQELLEIRYFNIHDDYFIFDSENLLIIDGAVLLQFSTTKLTLGWNANLELFDTVEEDVSVLLKDSNFYELDLDNEVLTKKFIGKKIQSTSVKWNWYQDLNDDYEPDGPQMNIIEELVLKFEDGSSLQIATVRYTLNQKNVTDLEFDPQGQLMISANNVRTIATYAH